ncbi:TPA: HAMP domain-containing histidine kinase [Clostridioides difficile]|nr:HAMP domain-containing histidine kinase [Clostridioides difficile]HDO8907804.1 HAMP domain-containing histidine kinase [Clostridioides difficile]HDO8938224.1 HAMP domain-containing histidine kinase [Clostridioides difficile]HDO9018610.1 HAMP domain-containing histidine kinase [Clostridioides difficile]HDO9147945.1 HAMP domain-containing histidine kinase [Clostridioides difficile]
MGIKMKTSLTRTFYKFLVCLLGGLCLSVVVPFACMMFASSIGLVTLADNNERQTKALVPILTATPNVSDIHFPTGTKFLRLTKNYGYIDTNMSEEEKEKALMFAKTGFMDTSGKTQFIFITRDDEYIVLQYVIGSQYLNAQFNQYLPSPEIMMISLITISSLGVCVYLTVHFAKELRKELTPILEATKEIENNNLDFTIGHSKILEFENVIISFDSMRNSLKGSLEKQWRSEKAQREQIASLAHDLKTPLTVMQGNIDLLDETELDEEQKLYLSYAMSSSEQMKQYIKILIDISKASAGYQLQMEDVNFPEFWKHVLSQTEIICKDKGIVIQQTQHSFPQNITGDRMLLERALMNLVSNSLEYSPENSTLYIDVDSKDNYLNICITDCGCGFSQEALDHAKERFYMADQSRSSKLHYGMGLYIVDIIIKQHKGKLLLDNSTETKGAKVTVKLPL